MLGLNTTSKTLLVLGQVPVFAPRGWRMIQVEELKRLSTVLGGLRPTAVVLFADHPEEREWLASQPPSRRPPTVVFGETCPVSGALADDWVTPGATEEEFHVRLELAIARAKLRSQASRRELVDPVTNLPNRRALVSALMRLGKLARRGEHSLGLVLVELNDFAPLARKQGRPAADQLLKKAGAALMRTIREGEVCGRLGGGQFVVIIEAGQSEADRVVARVQESLAEDELKVTAAHCVLRDKERLRDFYRRTDHKLRMTAQLYGEPDPHSR